MSQSTISCARVVGANAAHCVFTQGRVVPVRRHSDAAVALATAHLSGLAITDIHQYLCRPQLRFDCAARYVKSDGLCCAWTG